MVISETTRLLDKYRPLILGLLFFCFRISGIAQTYNPSTCCTVSNKAYGAAQAVSTDGRSWFYDATNFLMRDYNGTTEVFSYLNLAKYRSGHFPIFVHSGGVLQPSGVWVGGTTLVYWFKDSTGNANLVRWYTDSTGNPGGPFYAVANNLSEGNAGLIKGNLSLDLVNNTSDAQKNAATVSLTNHTIDGNNNTLLHIPNSALTNNTIGLTINANAASDISVTTTPAALGSSLVVNMPDAGTASRGPLKATDWNFFNGKLDSVHISNDSVYNCVNGTCTLQSVIVGAGAVNSVDGTNASLLFSPTTGNVLGQVNPVFDFNWTGQHSYLTFAPIFSTLTTAGGLFYGSGTGQLLQSGAGTSGQILQSTGGTAPVFFTPDATTVNGWLGYTALSRALASTHLFVGNGSNVATDVALSGDASILNTGAWTNLGLKGKLLPTLAAGFLHYTGTSWNFDNSSANAANQGLWDSVTTVQLGEPLGQSGSPSRLYQLREIPLNDFGIRYYDSVNSSSFGYIQLGDTMHTSGSGTVKLQETHQADTVNDFYNFLSFRPKNYGTVYVGARPNGGNTKAMDWTWGYSQNSSGGLPMPDNVFGGGYNILNGVSRKDTGDAALSMRLETSFSVLGAGGAFEMHWPELVKYQGGLQRVNSWYIAKQTGNTLWESNLNFHEYKKIFQHAGEDWLSFNSNGDEFPTMTMTGTHDASIDGNIVFVDSNGHYAQIRSIDGGFTFITSGGVNAGNIEIENNGQIYLNGNIFGPTGAPTANTIVAHYDDGSYPAQVASAQLAVVSQHKGFLTPPMTNTQMAAISSPADGLEIYNTTYSLKYIYQNGSWTPVGTSLTETSAGTLTIAGNTDYVFTGTTTTWTLPALSSSKNFKYFFKNAGSGNITLNRAGGDNIYSTTSVTSLTIAPGAAVILVGGPSFWYVESN